MNNSVKRKKEAHINLGENCPWLGVNFNIMFRNIDINIYDDREITIGIDEFIEDDGDEDDWDDDDPREYF